MATMEGRNSMTYQEVEALILSKEQVSLEQLQAVNKAINTENENYLYQKHTTKLTQTIITSEDPIKHITNTVKLCAELLNFCSNEKEITTKIQLEVAKS